MLNFGTKAAGSDGADGKLVFDTTDAGFMNDVIEASREKPIIVDFWAPWCGPCKTLGPMLEKVVTEASGAVALAKVDIDQNPMVAQQLRVQSIPAVFAFVNGQPVDGFMGALPESQLKQFVDQLVKMGGGAPGDADLEAALDAAEHALGEGAAAEAAQAFAAVLSLDATNTRAIAGMARCYAANGEFEQAEQTLALVPTEKADDPAVTGARSAIELAKQTTGAAAQLSTYRQAVEADPGNLQARFDLATALTGSGDNAAAIDELLEIFRRDRTWNDEAAKKQLMTVFEALGSADPLTLSGRRRLSSMIFA